MPKRIVQKIKKHFMEVLKIKKTPHDIAIGFAIGTLIGILPTPGISILLALLVILIYEKVSKISLFGAIIIWNPLLTLPLYPLSYKIGSALLKDVPAMNSNFAFFNKMFGLSTRFLVGNIIIAVSISAASYIFVGLIARAYQRKIKPRIELLEFKEKK